MKPFNYFNPTRIEFGAGIFKQLDSFARPLGGKALLVTGGHSAKTTGTLDQALAQLPGAEVVDGIPPNPATDVCEAGAKRCREAKCDFVVALGGGSAMDAAKAIAGLAKNPGPCSHYFGQDLFTAGALPVIAIPTTSGTGSEVTPFSVITDPEKHAKRTLSGHALFPTLALLDPELTVSMPGDVTVATGLDALSQGMEGLISTMSTPLGDTLALETCRLVKEWLPLAVHDGTNIEARSWMHYAAMLSGAVIAQSRTTLVHAMGYCYTIEFGIPHGLANALLLAPVFQYNAQQEPAKVAALATVLGFPADPTVPDARSKIGVAVHSLLREVGVSPAAKNYGVTMDRVTHFAEMLYADKNRLKLQPGILTLDEIIWFYEQSYEGTIE